MSNPYNNHIRNSIAHVDYLIDHDKKIATFIDKRGRWEQEMTYIEFNSLVQDMSAIVLVFRCLPFILGNNYWRFAKSLLDRME